jgi:subtilisin family serine protease
VDKADGIIKVCLLISAALVVSGAVSAQQTKDSQRYIVSTDGDVSAESLPSGTEVVYDYSIIDGYAVRMPGSTTSTTQSLEGVESVTPDIPVFLPVMPGEGDDTDRDSYNASGTVAVLDTGVDNDHVDLDSQVISNEDVRRGESNPDDLHGHGTHVASILAGTGDGNNKYRGLAPGARIRNYKVLDGSGRGKMSTVIEGVERASEDSDVIVMSLGAEVETCDGSDPLSRAVTEAAESGTAVVVAAGNSGPDKQTVNSPGCARKAFSIGASEGQQDVPDYSSRGPTDDGRTKPDLVAPGSNIVAAKTQTKDGYTSKTGTSMSAPYAAGAVAALIEEKQRANARYYTELEEKAFSLGENRQAQGAGRINLTAALNNSQQNSQQNSQETERDQPSEKKDRTNEGDASGRDRDKGRETGEDGAGGNQSRSSDDRDRNEDRSDRKADGSGDNTEDNPVQPRDGQAAKSRNQRDSRDKNATTDNQKSATKSEGSRSRSENATKPVEGQQVQREHMFGYLQRLVTSFLQSLVG